RAVDLRVRDPKLSESKRADVQARMIGPDVLDTQKFASIAFESTMVEAAGADRWNVTGRLTVHGQARPITYAVARAGGRTRGAFVRGLVRIGTRVGNERGDLAVSRAADIDAALVAGILRRVGLRIGHVQRVVLVDVNAARAAKLLPLIDELPVLVEDLDAAVA